MEKTNLLTLVITLTVGIILAGSLLMPVLDDATTTEKTFTNDGAWRMSEIKNGMEWDYSDGTWELDNVVQVTGTGSNAYNTINAIAGDDWIIRASGYIRGNSVTYSSFTGPVVVAANDQITITYGNNQTATVDLSGYGIDLNGDSILSNYDSPVYVLEESEIYATGQSSFGTNARAIIHLEGTIKDGVTGTITKISGDNFTDLTLSNIEMDYEEVSGYEGLYKLNKITATASCVDSSSNTQTGTVTYSSYVVPYKVTAELSEHLEAGEIALLNALPVLVIIGLVLAGVGAIFIRNRD